MRAKRVNESMHVTPQGNIGGDAYRTDEDYLDIINATEGRQLTPEEFGGFVDEFISINNVEAAMGLLYKLVKMHPYIDEEIRYAEGPYSDQMIRFVEAYEDAMGASLKANRWKDPKDPRRARSGSQFPPLSMN